MRYQGHGQVYWAFCGLIAVGDRRHDDHLPRRREHCCAGADDTWP